MDPLLCCALGLCCPPGSVEQFDAIVTLFMSEYKDERKAKQAALKAFPSFVAIGVTLHMKG